MLLVESVEHSYSVWWEASSVRASTFQMTWAGRMLSKQALFVVLYSQTGV